MVRLYLLGRKGLFVLQELDNRYLTYISEVVIGKDKSVINDYSNDIKEFCEHHHLNYYFRSQTIESSACKYIIAIGWRWLINSDKQLIVIHDSILPRLRGFNPLVTALINGDSKIGATALIAEEGYDEGPIIIQKSLEISYPIKIKEAIDKISYLYADIVNKLFDIIMNHSMNIQVQDNSKATYSLWRDEDDYKINWNWSSEKIKRFIDAVGYPYKGAFTFLNDKKIRILDAEVTSDLKIENRIPGKVLFKKNDTFTIVCGNGLLLVNAFYDDTLSVKIQFDNFRLKFE